MSNVLDLETFRLTQEQSEKLKQTMRMAELNYISLEAQQGLEARIAASKVAYANRSLWKRFTDFCGYVWFNYIYRDKELERHIAESIESRKKELEDY